jgi:hypothetical protein
VHIVLFGDSIFDNACYVGGGLDVIAHLRRLLPEGVKATLLARDGDVIRDVERQLRNVPSDATHFVVSIGGNDALAEAHILSTGVRSIAEALVKVSSIRDEFASQYRAMLDVVMRRQLPTAICTIYDGAADSEMQQRVNTTALAIFNDVISREAAIRGLPLIDLRVICNDPGDYANPIEPSVQGGAKIARAIAGVVIGKRGGP